MTDTDWLIAHLQAIGAHNPDGVSRAARPTRCPDCRRHVLRGLDDDRCAGVAVVDPHDIDHLGEFLALRIGLHTYSLRRGTNSTGKAQWNIDPRYPAEIRAGQEYPVLAQHRCGMAIPPAATSRLTPPPTRPAITDDQPPF